MPWGSGRIVEELTIQCPRWESTIQLMEYEDGARALRFCYYSEGHFGRGPMIPGEEDLERVGRAIERTKMIKTVLKRMAGV
jgi:hypothetical protein